MQNDADKPSVQELFQTSVNAESTQIDALLVSVETQNHHAPTNCDVKSTTRASTCHTNNDDFSHRKRHAYVHSPPRIPLQQGEDTC